MMSYAYLTLLVILAPAVLDGPGSSGAGSAFWTRFYLFVLIAVYGSLSVAVFDAFWPGSGAPKNRRSNTDPGVTKKPADHPNLEESPGQITNA